MEHLIISILGENKIEVNTKLAEIAAVSECNILDCRMVSLGQEFAASFHLSGSWNAIAKAESLLDALEAQLHFQSIRQRTKLNPYPKNILPYVIYITAKDQVGLLHKVNQFFYMENIPVTELYSETRPARKSGTDIISITMCINIPDDENIANLRERFIVFCDNYNLDGIMEAEKGT